MNLATIPLPTDKLDVTITPQTRTLPNAPGWCTGVVHATKDRVTVQCAVCLRTATARTFFITAAIAGWNHAHDKAPGQELPPRGALDYRRCPDCRTAHRHPAIQLALAVAA